MIGHVTTNAQERKIGEQFFKQAYGVSRPGQGRYSGRGAVGSTIERYAPGATNPAHGAFVTADPSQKGLAALRAAQSQVGVREASGNNDGIPQQRYAQGRKEPWCADFVAWSFDQSGHSLPGRRRANAGVTYMQNQAKRNGTFHTGTPQPGDVVFFNQKLAHSSWGGSSGRRFLGVTLGEKPTEDYHLEWIMQHANRWKEACMNDSKTQFPEPLTEHSSPRLRKALDYLYSRGF